MLDPFTDVACNELWDSLRLSDDAAEPPEKFASLCCVGMFENESTKYIFISNIKTIFFCLIGGLFYLMLKNILTHMLILSFINAPKRPGILDGLDLKIDRGFP